MRQNNVHQLPCAPASSSQVFEWVSRRGRELPHHERPEQDARVETFCFNEAETFTKLRAMALQLVLESFDLVNIQI